jgi:hypothetical protein
MYCDGLGLKVIGGFTDHQSFDGVMLGKADAEYASNLPIAAGTWSRGLPRVRL